MLRFFCYSGELVLNSFRITKVLEPLLRVKKKGGMGRLALPTPFFASLGPASSLPSVSRIYLPAFREGLAFPAP